MPWMVRKSGKMYYYRKRRVGGRVQSIYVPVDKADVAAQADLERAQERVQAREVRIEAEHTRAAVQAAQRALQGERAQSLAQAGYHQHRGEWRKRRARTNAETE